MQPVIEVCYFAPTDPFPEDLIESVVQCETDLMKSTTQWLSLQTEGLILSMQSWNMKMPSLEKWNKERQEKEKHYVVALLKDDSSTVFGGFAEISFSLKHLHSYVNCFPEGFPNILYLHVFYTNPQLRNKGVGTTIMTFLEQLGRQKKCKQFILSYNVLNTSAGEFYKNRSFRLLETQYYGKPKKPSTKKRVTVSAYSPDQIQTNNHFKTSLKELVSKDSRLFYPLYSEVDTIVTRTMENIGKFKMPSFGFKGGQDGYASIAPIWEDKLLSFFPLIFTSKVWNNPSLVRQYLYEMREIGKRFYNVELFHICSLDWDKRSVIESAGFVPAYEVLVKSL